MLKYRFDRAVETLEVAKELYASGKFRDSNNRSYYAAFYAIKAIYTIRGLDFKKHKTLLANFNKEYVATEIFPREIGRKISTLALIREQSDYNDFYMASKQESQQQVEIAEELITLVREYLNKEGYIV
ncbi:HEPN domain-containing protein [Eisenbergiella tayi]|uniref:HEPN domain-containing protein n=1 Tax=Eisenbergiella tayi TaxID=1432052 RepID=A0A1E3U8C8_9FIRM|nr:HEPN domain-containing protein [Eisenbergiella tayi]ODR43266.1 HEPN domain-containing protein [Eisenbergiella tayi]ODR49758.1 HEPN domain-containing protein [Eisenbergiella tayi]ODR50792.1 HEPN domain-containing protein [Eisenbergiella tayi]